MKECTQSVKLLVSDFDSTYTIEWENNNIAVEKFRGNGNIFAFCTGRNFDGFNDAKESCKLEYDYLSVDNGAIVYHNDEILFCSEIDEKIVRSVVECVKDKAKKTELYNIHEVSDASQKFIDGVTKIKVIAPDKETENELFECVKDRFGDDLNISRARHSYLFEISSNEASKATATKIIAEHAGIDKENVFTVGDAESDLSMLDAYNGYALCGCDTFLEKFEKVNTVSMLIEKIGD